VTKLHPLARIVLDYLGYAVPTNDRLGDAFPYFQNWPRSVLPSVACESVHVAALRHEDIISDLSPVFDSIPELVHLQGRHS